VQKKKRTGLDLFFIKRWKTRTSILIKMLVLLFEKAGTADRFPGYKKGRGPPQKETWLSPTLREGDLPRTARVKMGRKRAEAGSLSGDRCCPGTVSGQPRNDEGMGSDYGSKLKTD